MNFCIMLSSWRKLAISSTNSPCTCKFIRTPLRNSYCSSVTSSVVSAPTSSAFLEEYLLDQSGESDLKPSSVLTELPVLEDVSHVGPPISHQSFNFAAYANESIVLQKLIDLGVDFYAIERSNKVLPSYLLQLNFEKHVQPYIQFLLDKKVPIEEMGKFFTKNPFFFQNNLDDLQVRINYLQSKKFKDEVITSIVIRNPRLLNYSTVVIDGRLGYFQRTFHLTGSEVRQFLSNYPPIITWPQKSLYPVIFELKDFAGFTQDECKSIILQQPYVLRVDVSELRRRIEYMKLDMNLPMSLIASDPAGLINRSRRLRERHLFLKSLGKDQYDPSLPKYVSITSITHGNDATFCESVAKTSVETFNLFLKSI